MVAVWVSKFLTNLSVLCVSPENPEIPKWVVGAAEGGEAEKLPNLWGFSGGGYVQMSGNKSRFVHANFEQFGVLSVGFAPPHLSHLTRESWAKTLKVNIADASHDRRSGGVAFTFPPATRSRFMPSMR